MNAKSGFEAIAAIYARHFVERYMLPSEAMVQEFEEHLGYALPGQYRNYLLSYNGGYFELPNLPEFRIQSRDAELIESIRIEAMFALGRPAGRDYVWLDDEGRCFCRSEGAFLPIGYTEANDLIALNIDATDDVWHGNIALILREYIMHLADSLEEFFAGMELIP